MSISTSHLYCLTSLLTLHFFLLFMKINRFHVQIEKRLLSGHFQVESIRFAYLANCFYVHCGSLASNKFHTMFRILEAIDYFFTKELNNAWSLSDANTDCLKNFACAFGVFRALQSSMSGHEKIKVMCLIPFLSIIFIRTNAKSKEISEDAQKQLFSALYHAIESFKVAERIAVFALESNELQLMKEYRKSLLCVDVNIMDTNSSRYPIKKYDTIISQLTTRISCANSESTQAHVDPTFVATSRHFLSRKFDEQVSLILCDASFQNPAHAIFNQFDFFLWFSN